MEFAIVILLSICCGCKLQFHFFSFLSFNLCLNRGENHIFAKKSRKMKRYIEQLIDDLQAAKNLVPKQKPQEEMTSGEVWDELIEIDRIIDEEPDRPLHNIFGIDPSNFPPPEKLTTKQAQLLATEILDLWAAFHIEASYPEKFPLEKLYPMLVEKFKKPFLYFPMGITGIEFCHYEPKECPFGDEYCRCKEWELESTGEGNETIKIDPDELPF